VSERRLQRRPASDGVSSTVTPAPSSAERLEAPPPPRTPARRVDLFQAA